MATAHIDRLTNLEMIERPLGDGTNFIVELRRMALVSGILDSNSNPYDDYQVLQGALDGLTELQIGTAAAGHPDLILVQRWARLIPGDKDKVNVELRYEQYGRTLDSVPLGVFLREGQARLSALTVQKDRFGRRLEVRHQYPASFPLDESLQGKIISQVGDAPVSSIDESMTLIGRFQQNHPDVFARDRVGVMNNALFRDQAVGTWLCANASYVSYYNSVGVQNDIYEFQFELQRRESGWNPDVWYRDPRTGRMPEGLVEATGPGPHVPPNAGQLVGLFEVDWFKEGDYAQLFPLA